MPPEELRGWLTLLRCPRLPPNATLALVEEFGSAAAALAAGRSAWSSRGLSAETMAGLATPDQALLASDLAWCTMPGRGLLPVTDPRYPNRLRQTAGAPPALFFRGDVDLLQLPQIAVVGSRNATPQGLDTAEQFAAELARRGLAITSGLALGIDAAAHRGCLGADGHTIAVCGTGLDRVYPARNKALAEEIERRGVLLSEFAPGMPPKAENFPQRNRILSGLSLGVLVVEAARESGSLITARFAAEQGREVFAIPGSIHNVLARGCHQLIRQGAKLVESADDILEEIGTQVGAWLRDAQSGTGRAPAAEHTHQRLLDAMGDHPVSVDSLVEAMGMPVDAVLGALMELEVDRRVLTTAGGRRMKVPFRDEIMTSDAVVDKFSRPD